MELDVMLFEDILKTLFDVGKILYKDKIFVEQTDTSIKETIGEEIEREYKQGCKVSKSTFKNSNKKINDAYEADIDSTTVHNRTILTIESVFEHFIKSDFEEPLLREKVIEVQATLRDAQNPSIHIQTKGERRMKTESVPPHLVGVYQGYFLRPYEEDSKPHISKLVLYIKENSAVYVKSTKLDYDAGKVIYQDSKPILVCKFEGTNNSATHIFQFSLTYTRNTFSDNPVLFGIYGGTDPKDTLPVCGKIIFEQKSKQGDDLEKAFKNTKAENYRHENSIADFFKSNYRVFDFLRGNKYIEDVNFFKNYSIHYDLKKYGIAGVYSIFSLDSSEFDLSIGVMKIDRLGGVEIKGSFDRSYKGFAKIFGEGILSINIFERKTDGLSSDDYFFNYLVKVLWDDKGDNTHDFYHGIRTIVIKNESIQKPSAARVIIKKEMRAFEDLKFERINILPYEFDRNVKPKKLILKTKKKTIDYNGQEEFIKNVIKYLQGDANNLLVAKGVKHPRFIKHEDYALVYFNAAINFANKGEEPSAKANFEKAILHGFYGKKYLAIYKKELTNRFLTARGKAIIKRFKNKKLNGTEFFYFS